MPIVVAALCEGGNFSPILLGIKHVRLLAVAGDAVALKVGDVGSQWCRAEGASLMPNDASLYDDATMGSKEAVAAKRDSAASKGRVSIPRRPPPARRIRSAMAGLLRRQ